jgi:hypothetical protein
MIPEEFIQEMAWRRGLGIAFVEIFAVVYVGYIGLIVLFFRKSEVAIGIICTVCAILCMAQPIGVLLALTFGWMKASQWQIRAFMALWSVLVALAVLNFSATLVLKQLDAATLRALFRING